MKRQVRSEFPTLVDNKFCWLVAIGSVLDGMGEMGRGRRSGCLGLVDFLGRFSPCVVIGLVIRDPKGLVLVRLVVIVSRLEELQSLKQRARLCWYATS